MADYQPKGMQTVNPYLMVHDVPQLLKFIETVFNGRLKYKLERPNGSIMNAEISIGDSVIMAGEPMAEYGAMPASLYIYVSNCDSIFEKAIQYGAESILAPTDMLHAGERYGGVRDLSGNIWWIATHIEDVSPEEQAERVQRMKNNWE